ncbi:hypothetical protein [Oceanospirillum sp.]|uniref:hypothetical protein n=1 Tax=Oceanospirillum sp. TaxID=2021254 RepID=UPI003A8D6007
MQGVIISFDAGIQEGVIRSESGEEFNFDLTGWRGRGLPDTGVEVSFEAQDGHPARQVFNLPTGQRKAIGTLKVDGHEVSVPWYKKLGF